MIMTNRRMIVHKWRSRNVAACGAKQKPTNRLSILSVIHFAAIRGSLVQPCKKCWRTELRSQ